ncbi:hypothetical protein ANO11243_015980 [Dothideomycetidae sp. 11243]|nr:hypothetical protein ANO11243_015980 [fungal sp. No.11243]
MPDSDSDVGPDHAPPSVPTGCSRKYYFVQISTGVSTWDVPTTPAPTVPTPGSTPVPPTNPYPMPEDGHNGAPQEGERGLGVSAQGQSSRYPTIDNAARIWRSTR